MTMPILLVCCFISIIHLLDANQQALFGSTVKLLCPHKATSSNVLRWDYTKEGSFPVFFAENTYINTFTLSPDVYNRLSISGNHTAGEYHLNIADVRKSDEGGYECSVGMANSKIMLTVIVGPTAVTLENVTPDSKIPGIEGQAMTIKCTAVGGQPPPDVKLVILGSTYTGKQSAQHTFKPHNSDDGSFVSCEAGYKEIEYYPLSTSANIYLKFKPVIKPFAPDIMTTEETSFFYVSCRSTGSRPAATMYWLLGKQNIDITSNSSFQSNHESSTNKYTVTSNLRYSVDRRYIGEKLTCRASNVAGHTETYLTLKVNWAPDVTVENNTFSQTQLSRLIHSTFDSNPPVNICRWYHRNKYGELIRNFSDNNTILTLPIVSKDTRYQDSGEYVCTAENGIIGMNGQLKQTGSGYVISNAEPVITADNKDNSTQYGKLDRNIKVYVNVYSIPKFSRISWYIGNTQLVSNKYVTKEEPALVHDVFHGVKVQLDGYMITLTISDLQEADFTNYTLRLYHSTGSQYVQHKVTLESANAPDTPSNFSVTNIGETSTTVQWIPGYDGGQIQVFFIEYRISGTASWTSQTVTTNHQLNTYNVYILSGLQDKTRYELRMYAENRFNQSQRTYIQTATTKNTDDPASSSAIIGVVGVIVVLLIVCVVIAILAFLKRRKGKKPSEKNAAYYVNSGGKKGETGDEYEEVANTRGIQHTQCSKTYESLGAKNDVGAVCVYEDLHNTKGKTLSKFQGDNYEALSAQDKPILYDELNKGKGKTEEVYVNEVL